MQLYEDSKGPIVCVALVAAKPDIFLPDVSHVLVVANSQEIITIGISVDQNSENLCFYQTDMTVSSDNVKMQRICGTKGGRIFMAGDDGYLYEFDYKAHESWFSRRCNKICHPPSKLSYFLSLYDGKSTHKPTNGHNSKPDKFGKTDPIVDLVVDESRNMLYQLTAMHNLRVRLTI